jgi:hypothetical protein
MENINGHAEERVSELDGAAPDSTDSALYFCTYAYLFHQVCLVITFSAAQPVVIKCIMFWVVKVHGCLNALCESSPAVPCGLLCSQNRSKTHMTFEHALHTCCN